MKRNRKFTRFNDNSELYEFATYRVMAKTKNFKANIFDVAEEVSEIDKFHYYEILDTEGTHKKAIDRIKRNIQTYLSRDSRYSEKFSYSDSGNNKKVVEIA